MPEQTTINVDKPEEGEKLTKPEEKRTAEIDAALHTLHGALNGKFTEYSSKRYYKEQEWIKAERQYSGLIDLDDDKKSRAISTSSITSQPPVVNITRQKTNIAVARMQDIQFPLGNHYNFTVEPTDVPDLQRALEDETPLEQEPEEQPPQMMAPPPPTDPLQNTGPPVDPNAPPAEEEELPPTIADEAYTTMLEAHESAHAMQNQIRDRLTEADYGKKARHAMDDLCRLGTAILKGPVHQQVTDRHYNRLPTSDGLGVEELELTQRTIPTVQWVDPRLFYPDPDARPGGTMDDAFEIHLMSRRDLIKLSQNGGYMKERIREVLATDPDTSELGSVVSQLSLVGSLGGGLHTRYTVKEYHGALDKVALFELELITEKERDDALMMFQGEVWFCNNHIIRVTLAPLEGDTVTPYFICTWEEDKSAVFGHGIPYLMRHAQRVVNSSWLMLLDNAGLTAGPQIVLNREMIRPAAPEEGWTIAPMKVWFMTEYGADVNDAMQFVNVPTQQESISNITELAMNFADVESSIPQIVSGEIPQGNNTMGGTAMVLSASHIIQQRVSERWDDCITLPLVQRWYDWEMQYSDDEELREGDLNVKVGGATERIDKQVKAQDIERILGLAGTNPDFIKHIDADAAFRELAATTRAGDIVLPLEEVRRREEVAAAEAENAPPDPEQMKAQAAVEAAQAKTAEIQAKTQLEQARLQLEGKKAETDIEIQMMDREFKMQEMVIKVQLAQMEKELKLMELASAQGVTQAKMAQDLDVAVMTETTKRLLKEADMEKFREEIAIKRETGEGI
jgi:hypothetical protein